MTRIDWINHESGEIDSGYLAEEACNGDSLWWRVVPWASQLSEPDCGTWVHADDVVEFAELTVAELD